MIFLDMDGTITESREVISKKMKKKLSALKKPFMVVSGAEVSRIEKQMDGVPCLKMGQNGNDAPDWKNELTNAEKNEIRNHIYKFTDHAVRSAEYIHDRGCQISYSFTGHSAPIEIKRLFDPDKKIRRKVLKILPFKSKTLQVRVAGTTCLDYNRKGNLKGDNLKLYMKLHNLKKKDCVYYGDNFDKGGNDESVLGVMRCVKVKSPDDLYKKL